jgi:hypothetical protein
MEYLTIVLVSQRTQRRMIRWLVNNKPEIVKKEAHLVDCTDKMKTTNISWQSDSIGHLLR